MLNCSNKDFFLKKQTNKQSISLDTMHERVKYSKQTVTFYFIVNNLDLTGTWYLMKINTI